MRGLGWIAVCASLAGCPTPPQQACGQFEQVFVWADADGDGFGVEPIGWVCEAAVGPNEATNEADCDDTTDAIRPDAEELCDLLDNDCDGSVDETIPKSAWYADADGDGYGANQQADFACQNPGTHVESAGDCDDSRADVNPLALEICNEIDDDCDALTDDADGGVDPTTRTVWHPDNDLDGFGDASTGIERCQGPTGSLTDGTDCNDAIAEINPSIVEICNEIDDDCDALVDDFDTYVDPATQTEFYADADLDGYGDATQITLSCDAVNGASTNDDDCDDSDPIVTIPTDWYLDLDADGYGSGVVLSYGCFPPGGGTAPGVAGLDCDEADPLVNPGATEVCGNGVDEDCEDGDRSCGPIGSYLVESGANWTTDPAVRSCIEACAIIFGGAASDYHCSTSSTVENNMAYMSGYADAAYCSGAGRPEDYKLEPVGNPGYNCGSFGCAYSAYVQDNCFGSRNYCWLD